MWLVRTTPSCWGDSGLCDICRHGFRVLGEADARSTHDRSGGSLAFRKRSEGEGGSHTYKRIPRNRSTRRVLWAQRVLRCFYMGGRAPSEGEH